VSGAEDAPDPVTERIAKMLKDPTREMVQFHNFKEWMKALVEQSEEALASVPVKDRTPAMRRLDQLCAQVHVEVLRPFGDAVPPPPRGPRRAMRGEVLVPDPTGDAEAWPSGR
jgi:hypothetical protein